MGIANYPVVNKGVPGSGIKDDSFVVGISEVIIEVVVW